MKLLVLLALVSQAAAVLAAAEACDVQDIDGPIEAEVTIHEDDCKIWEVTGLIKSLTVTSSSASEEVEDVDVTVSDAGGVSGFLAVGDGGNAKATNIAVNGSVGKVRVGYKGKAINTNIAVAGSVDEVYVGYGGTAADTKITLENGGGVINVYSGAKNTNIVNNGPVAVTIYVVSGKPTGTSCNGVALAQKEPSRERPCSCPINC